MWECNPKNDNTYRCIPCHKAGGSNWQTTKHINQHENQTRHRDAVQNWKHSNSVKSQVSPPPTRSSSVLPKAHNVLQNILASMPRALLQNFPSTNPPMLPPPEPPPMMNVDFDVFQTMMDDETPEAPPPLPATFINTLEAYLAGSEVIDHSSDDEGGERSDIGEPENLDDFGWCLFIDLISYYLFNIIYWQQNTSTSTCLSPANTNLNMTQNRRFFPGLIARSVCYFCLQRIQFHCWFQDLHLGYTASHSAMLIFPKTKPCHSLGHGCSRSTKSTL